MRRLLLVLAALALVAPASAGAQSAKPYPRVVVKTGSVHLAGGKLVGDIVMTNDGRRRSGREVVELGIGTGLSENGDESSALVQRLHVKPLEVGAKQKIPFTRPVPGTVSPGRRSVSACVDGGTCRRLGFVTVVGPTPSPAPSVPSPSPAPPPSTPSAPTPTSTVPTDPISYVAGTPFEVTGGSVPYWAFVPGSYDASNLTPAPLLIWLHGCYGYSEGDIWVVDPGAGGEPQDWLTIAVGGREGDCWTPSVDEAKVMAALEDVETHFNVDRRRVILGGYSSGGDLAYRTGFRHSSSFAGLLIENSSPFRDTESSAAESLGAATTRPHIVHLAHTGDTTYPLAGVQQELGTVAAAGFPIELIERPGSHSDANTDTDLRELLLPHIDDGWLAPAP
jgi:hypothetical protein